MTAIKDRHGRRIGLTVYGAAGAARELDAEALEAALRVKRVLSGKPELCAKAILKILGLAPVRLGIRLWSGKEFLLNVPADLGNFLCDLDGIIIRDQYNAGDLAGKTVVDAGANIGLFSLYASALGAKKVHSFEAVAETCKILIVSHSRTRHHATAKAMVDSFTAHRPFKSSSFAQYCSQRFGS